MTEIERFGSDNPWEATVGYCRAVRAGDHAQIIARRFFEVLRLQGGPQDSR